MEFKDLPTSIQEIAAHTLRHRLNELALESVAKKDTDNMARNVRDAFRQYRKFSGKKTWYTSYEHLPNTLIFLGVKFD
ncbi:hypothetical protein A6C84_003319 [Escherichia coli]